MKNAFKRKNQTVAALVVAVTLTARCLAGTAAMTLSEGRDSVHAQLEGALRELAELRRETADRIVPLNQDINSKEKALQEARTELEESQRALDMRNLGLNNLRQRIKARKQERTYLKNLLGEYVRNLETQIHIAQISQYHARINAAKLTLENENADDVEAFSTLLETVDSSVARLEALSGGDRFRGQAVTENGTVTKGTFIIVGPSAFFVSDDRKTAGMAVERLGSTSPNVIPVTRVAGGRPVTGDSRQVPSDTTLMIAETVANGYGWLPLDATLGKAQKMAETKETLKEHLQKGGIVVYPILGLAGIALLTALFKWIQLSRTPLPSEQIVRPLLIDVHHGRQAQARKRLAEFKGPIAVMLKNAVDHLHEPRELMEELMYEQILETRIRLSKGLPFLAVCASSAPLLGLLGTVTGIISTFKLITAFGSGDVKMLSAGISEALITTELGLVVAIPALLLHAFLNRRSKAIVDRMEKTAVAFLNQVSTSSRTRQEEEEDETPGLSFREELQEVKL